jgi:hypothetical protein
MKEDIKAKPSDGIPANHRGNPIFDRFFSQIVKAIQDEDGTQAYDIFVRALEMAAQGKGKLS